MVTLPRFFSRKSTVCFLFSMGYALANDVLSKVNIAVYLRIKTLDCSPRFSAVLSCADADLIGG
jgi:hypothetical protein